MHRSSRFPAQGLFVAERARIVWSCGDLSNVTRVLGGPALVSIYFQSQAHLSADFQHEGKEETAQRGEV